MPNKCDSVEWDENGFAKTAGSVEAARIDQGTGIWLGNEIIPVQAGVGLPPDYILDLPPEKDLPFSYGWGRINDKWERVQLPATWEIPHRYVLERIPPSFESYNTEMWKGRFEDWVKASHMNGNKEINFENGFIAHISIDIQGLGRNEENLLKFERFYSEHIENNTFMSVDLHINATSYLSDSKNWVLGLYEVMRVLRNDCNIDLSDETKEKKFEELFYELELIRMPLAKHEARQKPGCKFSPGVFVNMDTKQIGWWTVDFNPEKLPKTAPQESYWVVPIFRRELADKFISIFA